MADITFRAKVRTVWYAEGTACWRYVNVPTLTRRHCDLNAFRCHRKYGGIANSDLFPAALARIRRDTGETIRLDHLPANVTVDESGFLAVVVISV
jgi:hypothetical protein